MNIRLMRTFTKLAATAILILVVFVPVHTAQAGIVDDIYAMATAARNRATEARDRATEARARATEARDAARENRDLLRQGADILTADIVTMVNETIADMNTIVAMELNDPRRDAFVAANGEPFRTDLIDFLQNLENLVNETYSILEIDYATLELQQQIDIIRGLPPRFLWPLYRVVDDGTATFAQLPERLVQAVGDLIVLKDIITQADGVQRNFGDDVIGAEAARCELLVENNEEVHRILKRLGTLSKVLKVSASIFMAVGETEFSAAGGFAGFALGEIEVNIPKTIGRLLKGLHGLVSEFSEDKTVEFRYCINLHADHLILQNQERILEALNATK